MAKHKVGIVGGGFAASNHIDALSRLRDVEIVAVADRSPELARAAAEKHHIPAWYGDYRDLLADPEVEVVHNCTPNHLHAEVNRAALQAGKHLLSEKPLAISSAETGELVRLAEARAKDGVVSGVCFNYRHYPLVRQIKAMLDSQQYGSVHFVHGSYLQDWLLYDTDWNWRLEVERNGLSRAVADIGSHWSDLMQYIVGSRISEVCADLSTLHAVRYRPSSEGQTFGASGAGKGEPVPVSTEDFGTVMFRFENGARGVFSVSQVSPGRKNRLSFEVDASQAAFSWDQEHPNDLWIGRRNLPNMVLGRDPSLMVSEAASMAHLPGGHQEGWPDALRNLFTDFYSTVDARRNGEAHLPSFASLAEGHRVMQLVEAIMKSNSVRGWVRVGSDAEV